MSIKKSILLKYCVRVLHLVFASNVLFAQQGDPTAELYSQVLDRIFPMKIKHLADEVFSLTLRFRSPTRPEEQIILILNRKNKSKVELLTSDRNIEHSVNEMLERKGPISPDALARSIGSHHNEAVVSPEVLLRWQRLFLKGVRDSTSELEVTAAKFYQSGLTQVVLDSDVCDLWYSQGLADMQLHVTESDLYARDSALGAWILTLRGEIRRLTETNRPKRQ